MKTSKTWLQSVLALSFLTALTYTTNANAGAKLKGIWSLHEITCMSGIAAKGATEILNLHPTTTFDNEQVTMVVGKYNLTAFYKANDGYLVVTNNSGALIASSVYRQKGDTLKIISGADETKSDFCPKNDLEIDTYISTKE